MSCDFYFIKWKVTLRRLEILIKTDVEYQTEKFHDQHLSAAVQRVCSILSQYMTLYNTAIECVQNNLQVQKTKHMHNIVNAIVYRILELKENLEKLECSNIHFFGDSLTMNHQTPLDPEMTTVLKAKRPLHVQDAIEIAFQRAKEKKEALEHVEESVEEEQDPMNELLRMILEEGNEEVKSVEIEEENKLSEEERVRIDFINLIKAHEKLRQVTRSTKLNKIRREMWQMDLAGTAQPPARYELRERAAQLIQKIIRSYLEIKRKRVAEIKRNQLLGLTMRRQPNVENLSKVEKTPTNRSSLYDEYEKGCILHTETLKERFKTRKGHELAGDYRDQIRHWFYVWFESIRFIHEIPKEGPAAILKQNVPEPHEWLEKYNEKVKDKEGASGKSPQQIKFEKEQANRLAQMLKKQMQKQQKAEAALKQKMMKHPKLHPGYTYPQSKKTKHLLEAINSYQRSWNDYDAKDILEVKRKYIEEKNADDAYKTVKIEILNDVHKYMETEYRALITALKNDYKNNNEEMPQPVPERKPKKKPKKVKPISAEQIVIRLEALALQGFVVEYPETTLEDYVGDPNFAGEDLRRLVQPAFAQSYELRAVWWDRCYAASQESHRILLVGPEESGKITLVHAMASMNGATLFEVDPMNFPSDFLSPPQLTILTNNFLFCAKAVQPSVIYFRHVQKLYYRREPPEEADLQLPLIQKYFVQNVIKKIKKQDKITIVGTCSDPWLTQSSKLLKHFPIVVLLPNVTYSLTVQQIKKWIDKHPSIPSDFNASNLAHMLQGYSYGYLETILEKFMSFDRPIRIAVNGLTVMDVYNYILENEPEAKVEYDLYLKWYYEKTPAGIKERQHFKDQVAFQQAVEEYEEKQALKKKIARKSAPSSAASSRTGL